MKVSKMQPDPKVSQELLRALLKNNFDAFKDTRKSQFIRNNQVLFPQSGMSA